MASTSPLPLSADAAERAPRRSAGYALVVVMGLLSLLGLIATSYAGLATSERQTSASFVVQVRARMAAQSGLEYAVAELRTLRTDPDEFGTSPLARRQAWSDMRDAWVYGEGLCPPFGPRAFGTPLPALARARRPSFPAGDAVGFAFSGPPLERGTVDGLYYSLRVVDCAAQVHVNDANADLARILDNLGELTGAGRLGARILSARPPSGYRHKRELLDRAFGGDARRFARVEGFLTCHAWVDRSTVRWSRSVPRWKKEPRAPVNVNTASPEVLTALLWGARAEYTTLVAPKRERRRAEVGPLSRESARRVADHVIAQRVRFGGGAWAYNDWMHFCTEVIDSARFLSPAERDLVKAVFNPGSDIRKLNPDRILMEPNPDTPPAEWTGIDKSDVTAGGTEACFSSMGHYEIESIGRVVENGRVAAEHRIETVCRLFDVYRASTQKELETGREWHDRRFGSLASEDGFPAVVSGPEYPFAVDIGYRAEQDLSWAAEWDGHLQLAGLVRVRASAAQGKTVNLRVEATPSNGPTATVSFPVTIQ